MNDLYPDLGQRGPGNVWELRERWTYTWPAEGREWRLTLVEGYAFEPSVPRVVWPVVSPLETLTASAPHDFVYRYEGRIPPSAEEGSLEVRPPGGAWTPFTEPIPRRNADRLFGRILREQEVVRWRRRLAFTAVHWFGAAAWDA